MKKIIMILAFAALIAGCDRNSSSNSSDYNRSSDNPPSSSHTNAMGTTGTVTGNTNSTGNP